MDNANDTESENFMTRSDGETKLGWRAHAGELAWFTLGLFFLVVAGEIAVWWGVLSDRMPMWAGTISATLLAYVAFTVMHEATHGNIHGEHARLHWVGEIAGWLSALTLLAPYPSFRVLHLQHHANTNHPERDPDYWVRGHNPISVILRSFSILLAYEYNFFLGTASKTRAAQTQRRLAVLTLWGLLGILVVLIATGFGWEALWLWVVPALTAAGVLAFSFDWVPHHPHNIQERFRDTRILLVPGLTLPMLWQNYHLIHHLYPRVPFYRYAACFRDIRGELEAKGAPIEGFDRDHAIPRPFVASGSRPLH